MKTLILVTFALSIGFAAATLLWVRSTVKP